MFVFVIHRRLLITVIPFVTCPPLQPNLLPSPLNPNPPPIPLLEFRVVLPPALPPSVSISMRSSSASGAPPRFPAPFSSDTCSTASSARSFFLRSFSRWTARAFTSATCASSSAIVVSHRLDHVVSVDCRDGRDPGARSRSGATEDTATRECAGSRVAVSRPA